MTTGAPADAGAPLPEGDRPPRIVAGHAAGKSDEALMTAYAHGDAMAFEALYGRHRAALYRYFRRQLDEASAHDCFQKVWLAIIRSRRRYSPDAPFAHYLFTLAHNVLMDHHRGQRRRAPEVAADAVIESLDDPSPGPEDGAGREEIQTRLKRLVAGLPVHQREAWLLRQETDFSTADIARITGTSVEGVKSRLRYAREKLKQGLSRYAR